MHVPFCLKERAQLLKGSERSNGFMQKNWLKGSPLACTPEGSKGLNKGVRAGFDQEGASGAEGLKGSVGV